MTNGDGTQFLSNAEGGASALVGTGGKGMLRTVEGLPEATQQAILDLIGEKLGKDAERYLSHSMKTNWGLLPVRDELHDSYGRDFKEDVYREFVSGHNKAMGIPYSVLGLLKETPFLLPFGLIGNFLEAANFKSTEKDVSALLKELDDSDEQLGKHINSTLGAPQRHTRYGQKINEDAIIKAINKGIADAQKDYVTTGDMGKLISDLSESMRLYVDEVVKGLPAPAEGESSPLTKDDLDKFYNRVTGEKKETNVERTVREAASEKGGMLNYRDLVQMVSVHGQRTPEYASDLTPLTVIYKQNLDSKGREYMWTIEQLDPKDAGYQEKVDNLKDHYNREVKALMATFVINGAITKGIDPGELLNYVEKLTFSDTRSEKSEKSKPEPLKYVSDPGNPLFEPNL